MKKKKGKKKQAEVYSVSGQDALSTVGEQLWQKYPDMMKKFEAFQVSESSGTRQVEVVRDLLPYPWEDPTLLEKGIRLTVERKYKEAVKIFQELVRKDPNAYPAYHLLGHVHGCLKNHKDEIDNYRKAIRLKPDYPQVYYNLGVAYWIRRREKKAFAAFLQAAPLAPEFAVPDYWLTFVFDRLGRFPEASRAKGREAALANRTRANAYYILGNTFIEFGLHVSARQAFKKALIIWPEFARAQYQLGAIHIKKLRNPKRAAKYLEKAEQLFIRQNDLHRAALTRQLYCPRKEVQEKNKAADEWLKEGLRLQQFGRYQGAIDAYKMAVSLKENFLDAFYNMGIAYGSQEDMGLKVEYKAVWVLKKAISIKPDFIHAYVALGAAYIKKREFGQAVSILESALTFSTDEPNVYYYLGIASRMSGKYQEAADCLKKAVILKPVSVQNHFYLGLACLDSERYLDACEAFQEAVRIKPDFPDGHFMLGSLYLEKIANHEKALTHLKKAEKLFVKLDDQPRAAHIRELISHQPA